MNIVLCCVELSCVMLFRVRVVLCCFVLYCIALYCVVSSCVDVLSTVTVSSYDALCWVREVLSLAELTDSCCVLFCSVV